MTRALILALSLFGFACGGKKEEAAALGTKCTALKACCAKVQDGTASSLCDKALASKAESSCEKTNKGIKEMLEMKGVSIPGACK